MVLITLPSSVSLIMAPCVRSKSPSLISNISISMESELNQDCFSIMVTYKKDRLMVQVSLQVDSDILTELEHT